MRRVVGYRVGESCARASWEARQLQACARARQRSSRRARRGAMKGAKHTVAELLGLGLHLHRRAGEEATIDGPAKASGAVASASIV